MTTLELERLANVEGRLSVLQGLILAEVALTGSVAVEVSRWLIASGATATITDPSGTVGSSFPITAGQFIVLDSNAQITPTYTTLTWQPYGC